MFDVLISLLFFWLECSLVQLEPSICWLKPQIALTAGQLSEVVNQKYLHSPLVVGSKKVFAFVFVFFAQITLANKTFGL